MRRERGEVARDHDDEPVPGACHMGAERRRQPGRREAVGAQHLDPDVVVELGQAMVAPVADAGIVDQHVDRGVSELRGQPVGGGGVADIELVRRHRAGHGRQIARRRDIAAAGMHPPAIRGETARQGEPQSSIGSGHDDALHAVILAVAARGR